MFNLQNFIGFVRRFLMDFIPLTLLFLMLAFLTELFTHRNQWPRLLFIWQFWIGVALNMAPAIIITFTIFFLASRFMKSVYGLEKRREGFDFLARSRFGQAGFSPFEKIGGGQFILNANGILTKVGGPGSLLINNDSAVVLEKAGHLTRVKGPGFHKLERFEKIYDIIDLQPQQWPYSVGAMTKEGIPVTWEVDVRYQIADGGNLSTSKAPYPYSEEVVFKAAICKWRRETARTQDMNWGGRIVIGATEGTLRSFLARCRLDELIGLTKAEEQAAREAIQKQLAEAIREPASNFGAKILQVKLANLQVRDVVTQEWIEAWRTRWQGRSQVRLGKSEAGRVFLHETVKAKTQVQYIIQIAKALQEEDISSGVFPAVLSMRLFSVLDRARAAQMMGMGQFPLSQIWDMSNQIQHLMGGEDNGKAKQPGPKHVYDFSPSVSQAKSPPFVLPTWVRIISFGLPVIDEIAAGKARIVSDDVKDCLRVGQLEIDGQPVTVNLLKGDRIVLYPEYSYFAARFPEDCLEEVDISADDCVILQKPKWSELKPEEDDIVVVLSQDGGQRITLRQLEMDDRQNFAGEIVGIAIAQLKPAGVPVADAQIDRVQSVPVGIIPVINPMSTRKATPTLNDVTRYVCANNFEYGGQLLKTESLKGKEIIFQPGNDYFIMRVSGDSMDQAGIAPGDYVILQKASSGSLRPTAGDSVAVVFRDGEDDRATLKRLQTRSGQVIFRPESSNSEHQPIVLPVRAFSGDKPQIEVVGIAIGVLKPK